VTDRLLSAALERIPPQLEAPSEARESSQTLEQEPQRAEAPPGYRRDSGGRTEALVATRVRWIDSTGGGGARGAVDRGT
jgi:hypothetical protein